MLDDRLTQDGFHSLIDGPAPQWVVAPSPLDYPEAVAFMEARVAAIQAGEAPEMIWLVEHPPLYTAGVSAKADDLIAPGLFPVYSTGRGGQYTYHGPGQRVAYVMLDLNRRHKDVRRFVQALEQWIIDTLWQFNVEGHIRDGRVGVWVERKDKGNPMSPDDLVSSGKGDCPPELMQGAPPNLQADWDTPNEKGELEIRPGAPERTYQEDKIAALGIKLRRWVSFHGISLNVEPDLSHFDGIVPCGIREHGVTSLLDLGLPVTMDEVDYALKISFENIFGPVNA
ncbi:lipoyl(octanoyl) transferase LipB, partial [Asticcacaulis biprosthecium]|uniref:lipoyl(octanoyl) transferase LipB n=1 Tax=Asticcacaulis biprosthecium TaxID=76891 RepID=UPI000A065C48